MRTVSIILSIAIFSSFVLPLESKTASRYKEEGLEALLPTSIEIQSWARYLEFEEYTGEDLYFYIDGGAEIYHEYGFEQVIVQDYKSENGRSASLEVYKMSSPESAYGIYTFKSSGKGHKLDIGHGCKLQEYYLNFWKGQYLVTVTGFDAEKETVAGLKSIAKAVDQKIQAGKSVKLPEIYSCLPQENLDAMSVKYFTGHLGLMNSYPFANTDIFNVQEGIKGTYSGGYDIYILKYKDTGTNRKAFESAKKDMQASVRYRDIITRNDRIELKDDAGIRIVVQPYRNFILMVLGANSSEQAFLILDNLKNQLS